MDRSIAEQTVAERGGSRSEVLWPALRRAVPASRALVAVAGAVERIPVVQRGEDPSTATGPAAPGGRR